VHDVSDAAEARIEDSGSKCRGVAVRKVLTAFGNGAYGDNGTTRRHEATKIHGDQIGIRVSPLPRCSMLTRCLRHLR
jgi:hypothetical protein